MNSSLENSIVTVITVVVFYVILSAILSFTWNRSISKVFRTDQVDLLEAFFLVVTANILFGTFQQSAVVIYNSYTSNLRSRI
jgi:uncharacterized membrane protein